MAKNRRCCCAGLTGSAVGALGWGFPHDRTKTKCGQRCAIATRDLEPGNTGAKGCFNLGWLPKALTSLQEGNLRDGRGGDNTAAAQRGRKGTKYMGAENGPSA